MPTFTTDIACINQSLEKIRQMLRENPHEAERLLDECPEMIPRIQEIVDLLRELQQEAPR
jgi:predicted nuclease with TOPRIM domain